jgi:hypothetical protein
MLSVALYTFRLAAPALADVPTTPRPDTVDALPPLPPLFKPEPAPVPAATALPSVKISGPALRLPSVLLSDHFGPALAVPVNRKFSIVGGASRYEPAAGVKAKKAFLGLQIKF